jgi:endonuclease G
MAEEFFEDLKDRIARDQARDALNDLRQFTRERAPRLYNETILQIAGLNQIEASERLGEMTLEEARVASAKWRRRVFALVDAAQATLKDMALPVVTSDVHFEHPPPQTQLEKIFGANNLKSIAWLRRGIDVARSVCRVVTPKWVGSGFVVSGGRCITNHHVVPSAYVADNSYVEFNVEEDLAGRLALPCRFALDGKAIKVDAELDVCVVGLKEASNGTPIADWGCLEFEATSVPKVGDHVTIIQHPGGGPKQIAITANQVVNVYAHRLQYSTDTMPGSSGSPVFNDDWKVVAIHRMGGNVVVNDKGDKMFANEGILMRDALPRLGF